VPLAYRRSGRREEIVVRLAGVHSAAELAGLVEGRAPRAADRRPPGPDRKEHPADGPARPPAPLPEAVRPFYEPRRGFANHHFNSVERDRVARTIAADGLYASLGGTWKLAGRLAGGEEFRIELSDREGVIDLPTGTTRVDATGELDANPSPPGSGGMLAALLLWRRLLREGPDPLGRTSYWGTAPLDPRSFAASGGPQLGDVLESAVAGVEARFTIDEGGGVAGIELWTAPDADPCEVRFGAAAPAHPQGMPAVIEVRHGREVFGVFRIESAAFEGAGGPLPGGGT
jgi:hypothetical protein